MAYNSLQDTAVSTPFLWSHGSDIHLCQRTLGGDVEVSLHKSGIFQTGFVKEDPEVSHLPGDWGTRIRYERRPAPAADFRISRAISSGFWLRGVDPPGVAAFEISVFVCTKAAAQNRSEKECPVREGRAHRQLMAGEDVTSLLPH